MDSYSPCFCSSGEKYKFCCQKAESQIFKVENLVQSEQYEAALKAAQEGLKRFPETAMLVLQKAVIESRTGDIPGARRTLEAFLAKHNRHPGALFQYVAIINALDGPHAAAKELQRVLSRVTDAEKIQLDRLASDIAHAFMAKGFPVAGLGHLRLAMVWTGNNSPYLSEVVGLLGNQATPIWLRTFHVFKQAPEGISAESAEAFNQSNFLANRGQWYEAIEALEALTDHDVVGPATFNRGLMYAYLGEDASAITCLRAYIGSIGETEEAVDLEAFCQELARKTDAELEDSIKLTWPIKSREQLVDLLDKSNRFVDLTETDNVEETVGEDDPRLFYVLLDKPFIQNFEEWSLDNIPSLAGTVMIDDKYITLTASDDGRLDEFADLLRDTAATAIVPAHPRTKHAGKIPKKDVLDHPAWFLPDALPREIYVQLKTEYTKKLFSEILPTKPLACLGGMTVEQAASGQVSSKIAARAMFRRVEVNSESPEETEVIEKYREKFNLPKESVPNIRPVTDIHVTRLKYLDLTQLSLPELENVARTAMNHALSDVHESAAREIITRTPQSDQEKVYVKMGYNELSMLLATNTKFDEAMALLKKGQDADPDGQTKQGRVDWELATLRVAVLGLPPEEWVPVLAALLEQYGNDQESGFKIFQTLLRIGLVRRVPDPENPGKSTLDASLLDYMLEKFAPRHRTIKADLGVSAGKPQIWTPGSDQKQGGSSVWTPGRGNSDKGQSGSGSKLIIPGR